MKNYQRLLVTVATLLASPSLANGQYYVELFGGASALSSTNVTGDLTGTADFGTGFVAGGAIGYGYADSPFRAEIEYAYRTGEADTFAGGASGDYASTILALNGYYDFAAFSKFTPYVGVGVGYVTEIDWDISDGGATVEYTEQGGTAFQLMLGTTYDLANDWALSAELRYLTAGGQTLPSAGGSISADYDAVELLFGVGLNF